MLQKECSMKVMTLLVESH